MEFQLLKTLFQRVSGNKGRIKRTTWIDSQSPFQFTTWSSIERFTLQIGLSAVREVVDEKFVCEIFVLFLQYQKVWNLHAFNIGIIYITQEGNITLCLLLEKTMLEAWFE